MIRSIDVAHLFGEDPFNRSRKIQKLWDELDSIDRILSRPSLSAGAISEFEVMNISHHNIIYLQVHVFIATWYT